MNTGQGLTHLPGADPLRTPNMKSYRRRICQCPARKDSGTARATEAEEVFQWRYCSRTFCT